MQDQSHPYYKGTCLRSRGRPESAAGHGPHRALSEEETERVGTQTVGRSQCVEWRKYKSTLCGQGRLSDAPTDLTCINVHAAEGWVLRFRNLATRPRSRSASNARASQLLDWLRTSFNRGRSPTSDDVPETEFRAQAHKARCAGRPNLAGSKLLTQTLADGKSEREVRPGHRYKLLQADRSKTDKRPSALADHVTTGSG